MSLRACPTWHRGRMPDRRLSRAASSPISCRRAEPEIRPRVDVARAGDVISLDAALRSALT
jgi:hypothetical protein